MEDGVGPTSTLYGTQRGEKDPRRSLPTLSRGTRPPAVCGCHQLRGHGASIVETIHARRGVSV